MTIRTKSRRRLLILLAVVLVVGLSGAVFYHLRESGLDEEAERSRDAGLEAFESGDYPKAVADLSRYIRRMDPSATVLLRYAQAIRKLPNVDARHLNSAVSSLRRAVQMDHENVEARRALLDLYTELGLRTESVQMADWFLDKDPSDEQALLAKARTWVYMKRYPEALDLLESQEDAIVDRLEEQLLRLWLMNNLDRGRTEIKKVAGAVQVANAADPRFGLVGAHAHVLLGDRKEAVQALSDLTLLPAATEDPDFAKSLLVNLDAAGMSGHILRVLENIEASKLDDGLRAALVQRMWEAGAAAMIPERVASWGRSSGDLPTVVLGYQAMALQRTGQTAEAAAVVQALDKRHAKEGDESARAWSVLMKNVLMPEEPSTRVRIDACREALEADERNPVASFELGAGYREAGESELAIGSYIRAAVQSRHWAEPLEWAARLFVNLGDLAQATKAAEVAGDRATADPRMRVLKIIADSQKDELLGGSFAERVLAGLRDSNLDPQYTAGLRLTLAAGLGDVDAMKAAVTEALDPDFKPDGDLLLSCAEFSAARKLGYEEQCYQRYEEALGVTPALVLSKARLVARTEGVEAGLALIRKALDSSDEGDRAPWHVVEALFLEGRNRQDEALAAWKHAAAPAEAQDAWLRRRLLEASIPWASSQDDETRSLLDAAVQGLREETGDSGLWWRFHRARWLLASKQAVAQARAEAIEIMQSILRDVPAFPRARSLLGRAYALDGQPREALKQYQIYRTGVSATAAVDLKIAKLHLELGDRTSARAVVDGISIDHLVTGPQLTALSALYSDLGERRIAMDLLERVNEMAADSEDFAGLLRRAKLRAATGELELAEQLVRKALARREDPAALIVAAAITRFRGKEEEADAFLARLRTALPDDLTRERLTARHWLAVGRVEEAQAHLAAAAALPEAVADDWRQLLSVQVQRGEVAGVKRSLAEARRRGALPAEDEDGAFKADLLAAAAERPGLHQLGAAYLLDPGHRSVAEQSLVLLTEAGAEPRLPPETLDELQRLAEDHPRLLALQMVVADRRLRGAANAPSPQREYEAALDLAREAMERFPTDFAPARAAAYSYRGLGFHHLAAGAARHWRDRAPWMSADADRFLTEVLVLHGQKLIERGRTRELRSDFEPNLSETASLYAWLTLARSAARLEKVDLAREMLAHEAVKDAENGAADLVVELGAAWSVVAADGRDKEAGARWRRLFGEVLDHPDLTTQQATRIGMHSEAGGDQALAEKAYRLALEVNADNVIALNNLAMLLAKSQRGKEAVEVAERVVKIAPTAAELWDTLASARLSHGDRAGALEALEKCAELQPGEVRWAIRILEHLRDHQGREAAKARLDAMGDAYSPSGMRETQRAKWKALSDELRGG